MQRAFDGGAVASPSRLALTRRMVLQPNGTVVTAARCYYGRDADRNKHCQGLLTAGREQLVTDQDGSDDAPIVLGL